MNFDISLRSRETSVPIAPETLAAAKVSIQGGRWPDDGKWIHDDVETVATDAEEFAGITYYQSMVADPSNPASMGGMSMRTWSWPARFQAIHMNLIPKGPHRGSVMVWGGDMVVGKGCTSGTATPPWQPSGAGDPWWTFQPWAILDPSPTAPVRFRNFLLPMHPLETDGARILAHSLFCAGQSWDSNGNLVIAGGCRFQENAGWAHGDYDSMYLWCPADTATKAEAYTGQQITFTGSAHYTASSGAWVQFEDLLTVDRYYPTATVIPPISRPAVAGDNGKPSVLVLGGSNGRLHGGAAFQAIGWNTYESFLLDAAPDFSGATWTSGYRRDTNNGAVANGVFAGPSSYDPVNNPYPDGNIYKDGFYFYPHMHVLKDGGIFMSSFAHKSSTLTNHGTAPGVWSQAAGHDDVPGLINSFRYYGTSVHLRGLDDVDVIYRIAGSQSPAIKTPENKPWCKIVSIDYATNEVTLDRTHNFADNDVVSLSYSGSPTLPPQLTANQEQVYVVTPVAGQPTKIAFKSGAAILDLTDPGSPISSDVVVAYNSLLDGYREQAWPQLPLDTRTADQIVFDSGTAQWEPGPALKLDRSLANVVTLPCGSLLAVGGVAINDGFFGDLPPSIHPLITGMMAIHGHDTSSVEVSGFVYPFHCEFLPYGGSEWQSLTWASSKTIRDYHSTAVLLEDGRVLVGGGERRRDFNGYDYEIYEPPYLVPDSDDPDWSPVRPELAGSIGGVSPTPNPSVVSGSDDAVVLAYGGQYQTTFSFVEPANQLGQRSVKRVTLVAPNAVTHHNNWNNHWQELACSVTTTNSVSTVTFTTPADKNRWLPGYAMLFAISDQGVPSLAKWVKFNA